MGRHYFEESAMGCELPLKTDFRGRMFEEDMDLLEDLCDKYPLIIYVKKGLDYEPTGLVLTISRTQIHGVSSSEIPPTEEELVQFAAFQKDYGLEPKYPTWITYSGIC